MKRKILRIGSQTYDLASAVAVDGLFSSVSYRLEPGGRGSRFPMFVDRLFAGTLAPSEAATALAELQEIETELRCLAPDRAVWNLEDLRRRDDRRIDVNRCAANLYDYFVTPTGSRMLVVIKAVLTSALEQNQTVLLQVAETAEMKRANLLQSLGETLLGMVWTVVGYLYFRNWVITVLGDDKGIGPLIWPAGIFIFLFGLAGLVQYQFPSIAEKHLPEPGKFNYILGLPSILLYIVLGYALKK